MPPNTLPGQALAHSLVHAPLVAPSWVVLFSEEEEERLETVTPQGPEGRPDSPPSSLSHSGTMCGHSTCQSSCHHCLLLVPES